jgi:hypothetical protein
MTAQQITASAGAVAAGIVIGALLLSTVTIAPRGGAQ